MPFDPFAGENGAGLAVREFGIKEAPESGLPIRGASDGARARIRADAIDRRPRKHATLASHCRTSRREVSDLESRLTD